MQISFSHLTRIRFHSLQIFSYFNIRNNIPFCHPSMHSIIFFQCPSENACQGCCIERNTRKSFHIPSSPGLAKTYHKNLSYKLSANPTSSPDQQHLDYPDDTYCIIIHDLMEYLLLQVILELYGISKDVSYIHFSSISHVLLKNPHSSTSASQYSTICSFVVLIFFLLLI